MYDNFDSRFKCILSAEYCYWLKVKEIMEMIFVRHTGKASRLIHVLKVFCTLWQAYKVSGK